MRRRWRGLVLSAALAALCAGTGVSLFAARYYPAYQAALEARDDLRSAQQTLRERRLDATEEDLAAVEAKLDEAERGFAQAQGALHDPFARATGAVPRLGGSAVALGALADIGADGVSLGHEAVAVARTYRALRERAASPSEEAEAILAELEPRVAAMAARLERLHQARERLTGRALPPAVVRAIDELDRDLAEMDQLIATYDGLSSFLPRFLGFDGPRTYLVLAQNNAELLPTGGLVSVYGVITVEEGRVHEQHFGDAIALGAEWLARSGAYVEPPGPLDRYLLRGESWNLAVSNWSPDFPTAAREAARFFHLATGRGVDGVIAINVYTIEELLRVTGPVPVPSYGVTVTAENALDVIEAHARKGSADRKEITGVLAGELLARLAALAPDRWSALLDALDRLRDGRQLLFYSDDGALQAAAQRLGIDGALTAAPGDFLMVVDASVNSTKLNIALEQRINLEVHLDREGAAYHRAAIAYHNDLPAWSQGRDPALVRSLMLGGQYGGYVRVLAPARSLLHSVSLDGREIGPEEIGVEAGRASFGRYFALPSGRRADVTFRYTSTDVATERRGVTEYRLLIQKQSGTPAIPLRIALRLPPGAELDVATLDGAAIESLRDIETDLSEDRELVIRYRKQ